MLWAVVIDESEWRAMTYTRRSPLWQSQRFPSAPPASFRAARSFPDKAPASLLECAARAGFWDLGVQVLRRLASHLGLRLPSDSKLFDVLLVLSKSASGPQVT